MASLLAELDEHRLASRRGDDVAYGAHVRLRAAVAIAPWWGCMGFSIVG